MVIAAYQAADVVAEAVRSALAQTRPPIEVIVCDDGSTDDITDVLHHFAEQILFVHQQHAGEAAAKNRGAELATGDYIAFLDADDVFLPERLEALSELLEERPDLDLVTTDALLVAAGNVVRNVFSPEFRFATLDQRRSILHYNFLPFAAVRTSAFRAAGGFDENLRDVPDWDLWLRMILDGSRAGLVDTPLAEYRVGLGNVTSNRSRAHRGKLAVLEKARCRTDLSASERAILDERIATEQAALVVCNARDALRGGEGARRACLEVIWTPHVGVRAKTNAAAAVIAPAAARRALVRRERLGVETTAGIRIDPAAGPSVRSSTERAV